MLIVVHETHKKLRRITNITFCHDKQIYKSDQDRIRGRDLWYWGTNQYMKCTHVNSSVRKKEEAARKKAEEEAARNLGKS